MFCGLERNFLQAGLTITHVSTFRSPRRAGEPRRGAMSAQTMGTRGLDKRGSFFKVKGSLDRGCCWVSCSQ